MNPRIPADYQEVGRWLRTFVTSHAKREDPRVEIVLEASEPREGRSYGFRVAVGGLTRPPPGNPPLEFTYPEVAEGRSRFAWCGDVAQRVRGEARRLLTESTGRPVGGGS